MPLNWRQAVLELEYICNDAAPVALLYGTEFASEAAQVTRLCQLPVSACLNNGGPSDYEMGLAIAKGELAPPPRSLDDVCTILYTSGTTGRPKSAMMTYGMGLYNAVHAAMVVELTSASTNLVFLPTFHAGGLDIYANPAFHSGGCNVVMRSFDPTYFLNLVSDKDLQITHALGVPTNFLMMAQQPGFADADLSHVVCLSVGGAAGINLRQMWGMTETGPLGLALSSDKALSKVGSSGLPMMHTRLKICDEDGSLTKPGEVGELMIKGPTVTPGYWNNPEANQAAFTEDGWFHTGDAARQDKDGFYYVVDRWKDMYISGGENVYPVEVENVIYQLAAVAVIGLPDEHWGEVGQAVIVVKEGEILTEADVLQHCEGRLARFKQPKSVRFVDALPQRDRQVVQARTATVAARADKSRRCCTSRYRVHLP